jgi:Carboxypeptidase regulatory-like domain
MNVRALVFTTGLFVLVAAGLAEAQFNAQLQGTVTDQTGGVLPGATVVLHNTDTGVELRALSDNDGGFRFPNLAPGAYQLKVELAGFRPATVDATVLTQQTSNVNVTLDVATAAEQVSVVGKSAGIDVADSRVHATYREEALRDLPFQGRNFLGLMAVAPGVTGKGAIGGGAPGDAPDNFSTEKTVDVNANGRNSGGNQFIMDGLNTTSNIIQGVANLSPNPDAIQEMAIQTNTFSVAEGRASSVNVAITTKSGTNSVRGTGSYIFTNQDFWSRPFFRTTDFDPFYKHDISGTIGGPIVQNRTFFFASVQPLFSRLTSADSVQTYESPEFVAWARQNFPNSLGTRVLTEHGMKNVVTEGVLRTARDIFGDQCGTAATRNIPCDLPMVVEGRFKPSPFRNGLQWNARVDHYLNGGRDRVYGNYFRTTLDAEIVAVREGYDTSNKNISDAIQMNWTRTFSPNLVNEFAFGWLRVEGNGGTDPALPMGVPNIIIGFQNTGLSPTWGPATFIQNNYNWKNVVTWVKGAHLLKFGFQAWYGDDDARFSPVRSRPTFDFNNLLELVTDDPREQRDVAYDPLTGLAAPGGYRHLMNTFGAYVQDDWKVRPNLTLTLGLRWDDYGDIWPDRDKTISFANIFPGPGTTNDERFATATVRAVDSVYGRRLNKNFSPRAGFAWDPSNQANWMIRGGVGLYKDWIPLGEANRITGNPPGLAFPVFRRGESPGPIFSLGTSNSYPFGFVLPSLPSNELNEAGGLVGTRVNTGGIDRDIVPANTLVYSVGFERQLPLDLVGGVTYSGSRTWDGILGTDFNRIPGDLVTDATLNRLNPNFAQMYFEFNGNEVWYNGLIFNVRRNLTGRTSFQASYTLSKVEDLGQAGTRINRDAPYQLVSQNFFEQYKAVADHDRRHRFSFAGSFHLPSPEGGNAITRALLSGWMVAGIGLFESGPPINVVNRAAFAAVRDANGRFIGYAANSGDYNADGFNYDYPDRPSQDFTGSHSRDDYVAGIFTAADFPLPEAGTLGNLPRFFYRGPGFAQVDLGFIKDSPFPWVGTRGKLQLRVDAFNIFNRVNLFNVIGDLNSATFGRSTGTFQPRVIQFGVRVSY